MPGITFCSKGHFYKRLKQEVDQYFLDNNLKKTGNIRLYLKAFILIPAAMLMYSLLLLLAMPLPAFILLCGLLGFTLACIGFNTMHDACHGCYSSKKWVNTVVGLSLNALGGNSYIWRYKHNLHHSFTNVDGLDDDIAKSPLLRQCESQRWLSAQKYQHIYAVLLYAASCVAWITILDFRKYFTQRIYHSRFRMSPLDHTTFWLSKLLYVAVYLVVPISLIGTGKWLIGFVFMQCATGLTLAFVFQLAHVVEPAEFKSVSTGHLLIEHEWAIHQVRSTANFAPSSKWIGWLYGGLNYQVEHHLFPTLSHIHYPAISKIVKKICQEFDLCYHSYPTMSAAMVSHYKTMKRLGKRPGTCLIK